jgi:hypothetical protein
MRRTRPDNGENTCIAVPIKKGCFHGYGSVDNDAISEKSIPTLHPDTLHKSWKIEFPGNIHPQKVINGSMAPRNEPHHVRVTYNKLSISLEKCSNSVYKARYYQQYLPFPRALILEPNNPADIRH